MREGEHQKMRQSASKSQGGTLHGARGSQLGVPLFFSLAPLDKTSNSVLLSFSLPTASHFVSMSSQENIQPQELWSRISKSQRDLAKSILIGAPGGKERQQKPLNGVGEWGWKSGRGSGNINAQHLLLAERALAVVEDLCLL